MGAEDRMVRQWEVAGQEMDVLRRFCNPVLEGVGKLVESGEEEKIRRRGKGERAERDADDGLKRKSADGGGRRGRVRFEVGNGGDGAVDEEDEGDEVRALVRRMWEGSGADAGGGGAVEE